MALPRRRRPLSTTWPFRAAAEQSAAAEAARVAAEQEAARVATEQEAARVAAEQEAARVAGEAAAQAEAERVAAEQVAAEQAAGQAAAVESDDGESGWYDSRGWVSSETADRADEAGIEVGEDVPGYLRCGTICGEEPTSGELQYEHWLAEHPEETP